MIERRRLANRKRGNRWKNRWKNERKKMSTAVALDCCKKLDHNNLLVVRALYTLSRSGNITLFHIHWPPSFHQDTKSLRFNRRLHRPSLVTKTSTDSEGGRLEVVDLEHTTQTSQHLWPAFSLMQLDKSDRRLTTEWMRDDGCRRVQWRVKPLVSIVFYWISENP